MPLLPEPSYRGKVRDVYDLGDKLILKASDRLSAFDVVFAETIPDKGKILTEISNHWFNLIDFIPNHLIANNTVNFPEYLQPVPDHFQGRSVLVKKAERIDFECVVRGYLLGSALKEYKETGTVAGITLPKDMKSGDRLAEPLFTPATKASAGHDINVTFSQMAEKTGAGLAARLRDISIDIFDFATEKLLLQGVLLLDTKLEFGLLNNEIILIDEVLTPDSSRFCTTSDYEKAINEGKTPPTMDKQIVRDYLETTKWNKQPPPPQLPAEIIEKSRNVYLKMKEIILSLD